MQDEPRAIVAISPDRQWLVVLDKEPYEWAGGNQRYWTVYEWSTEDGQYMFMSAPDVDTGQAADAVLAAWLEGRDG